MCGRFAFYSPREAVLAVFGVDFGAEFRPRWNVAPTQLVAAIVAGTGGRPEGTTLRWGLVPFWAKDTTIGNRLINARGESLGEKPAFRNAWRKRRCIVLASGFYEWRKTAPARTPFFIAPRDGRPVGFAGLWEVWDKGNELLHTCTIVTTGANRPLREIHDRMPVIVAPADVATWIDPRTDVATLTRLLHPAPDDLLACHEVSLAVNSPAHEGPELVAPVGVA